MKRFAKFAALGLVLAASAPLAFATPITGTVGFSGAGTFSGGSTGTFTPTPVGGPNALVGFGSAGTGTLSPFVFGSLATFDSFALTAMTNDELIFSSTVGGVTLDFLFENTGAASVDVTGNGVILGGVLTETGYTNTTGILDISANGTSAIFTAGVLPVAATPEPNSLLLMGTGLLGAAGLMFMRRRNTANLL